MGWLAALNAFLSLLKVLLAESAKRQERQAGKSAQDTGQRLGTAEALAGVFNEAAHLIEQADHARRVFRDQLRAHPDRLHDDDGFKRNDTGGSGTETGGAV